MFEHYILKGAKKLRCGYTTGSCAAAAAKAAALMLLAGRSAAHTDLMTPAGIMVDIEVAESRMEKGRAYCAVIKDGGDDPDVTDGALIAAEVSIVPGPDADGPGRKVLITGGPGVGRVTRKGLDQPVGEYAINSTPRRMITENVLSVMDRCGFNGTLLVSIQVPRGEEIALRTFNPRLGIEGGISIIGTTGIVEPMSDRGLLGTIRAELGMRRAEGHDRAVLTIGNYSGAFLAGRLPFLKEEAVTCSNFIGDAVDICAEYGFSEALIVGHLGKLVKLGAGIMNTHSANADGRMEVLAACGVLAGADTGTLKKVLDCVTADAALEELDECGVLGRSMEILAERIQYHLDKRSAGRIMAGAVLFSGFHNLVVMTDRAREYIGREV